MKALQPPEPMPAEPGMPPHYFVIRHTQGEALAAVRAIAPGATLRIVGMFWNLDKWIGLTRFVVRLDPPAEAEAAGDSLAGRAARALCAPSAQGAGGSADSVGKPVRDTLAARP